MGNACTVDPGLGRHLRFKFTELPIYFCLFEARKFEHDA